MGLIGEGKASPRDFLTLLLGESIDLLTASGSFGVAAFPWIALKATDFLMSAGGVLVDILDFTFARFAGTDLGEGNLRFTTAGVCGDDFLPEGWVLPSGFPVLSISGECCLSGVPNNSDTLRDVKLPLFLGDFESDLDFFSFLPEDFGVFDFLGFLDSDPGVFLLGGVSFSDCLSGVANNSEMFRDVRLVLFLGDFAGDLDFFCFLPEDFGVFDFLGFLDSDLGVFLLGGVLLSDFSLGGVANKSEIPLKLTLFVDALSLSPFAAEDLGVFDFLGFCG